MPPPPTGVSAPEGCSPGPGLPCPLMPTPLPPAARLPRGSSAQGVHGAGTSSPPDALTPLAPPVLSPSAVNAERSSCVHGNLSCGFSSFQEESVSHGCPESRGAGVGRPAWHRSLSPSILFTSASLLITVTATQLVVNKCQLTHG